MLSKVSRSLTSNILGSEASSLKAIVCFNTTAKRDFSIDQIGKRHAKPYDYKNKKYGLLGQIFDSTLNRLGDNSLIITVDGNFGSGKSEFAQQLAKDIDFKYAREPDLNTHLYEQVNGENTRDIINEIVGDNQRFRIDSLEEWHKSPSFKSTIALQHNFYNIRWMQFRTALLHLMSTGQGVVLERSVFSDAVIGQSLYDNNFLSDEAFRFYLRDLVPNTIEELWRPHVMIYLDKSPEECLKNIKEKGKPFEKESKVYTLDFLRSMDKNYKKNFLPGMRNELHVLSYDAKDANSDRVTEDLELLDFEDQTKFNDWRIRRETTINTYRRILSDYQNCVALLKAPNSYVDVPEYLLYGEDLAKLGKKLGENEKYASVESASVFGPAMKNISARDWL